MTEIRNCPGTLAEGYMTYSPTAVRRLFDGHRTSHVMDFDYDDEANAPEIALNVGRMSLSGAQEKLSAVWEKGKIILTPEGRQGTYILKPIPSDRSLRYRQMMPANEHLTMQIARQVYGILTAENGLIFFADGKPAYLTKRFDITANGSKIFQEDFASLIGRTEQTAGRDFKYKGSYADIAAKIRELLPAWQVEMAKFFRLVVFNYLFGNGDAHLKNFSVHQTPAGDYILTPAYDLINSFLHVGDTDFALDEGILPEAARSDVYSRTGHPCKTDFITFGHSIGLNDKQIERILTPLAEGQDKVYELTGRSFLDERLQRMYLRSYEERLQRFQRKE